MRAQRQSKVSDDLGIVTSNKKGSSQQISTRQTAAVVLVLVLALGAGGVYYSKGDHKLIGHKTLSAVKPLTPDQQAQQLASAGSYQDAQKVYDRQLKTTSDKNAQAAVYEQQAALAINDKKYDEAKAYAMKAEDLVADSGTAETLAYIAESQGDKATAATYYQKAIDRLAKGTPSYDYTVSRYQAKIKELSS